MKVLSSKSDICDGISYNKAGRPWRKSKFKNTLWELVPQSAMEIKCGRGPGGKQPAHAIKLRLVCKRREEEESMIMVFPS